MRLNIFKGSMAVILGSTMLLAACTKDADTLEDTNSAKIIGTWNRTIDALDVNNNNILDASEKLTVDSGDYEYITFASDGTFMDKVREVRFLGTAPYTWSDTTIRYDTSTWVINGDYLTIKGYTEDAKIIQIDNSNLILQDTFEHPTQWMWLVK